MLFSLPYNYLNKRTVPLRNISNLYELRAVLSLCKRTKLPNFGFHTFYGVEFLRLFQHPPKYFWHNKKASLRRQIKKKYLAKEVRILHLTETVLEPSMFFFKNS